MSGRKTLILVLVLAAVIWLLYPTRELGPAKEHDPNVVEIVYMGKGGPIAGAMDDAVKAFEKWSRDRHAKDPSKPIYRVVSGQNAARNQTADPTRFLVSVAGGAAPDVIWFDRFAVTEWSARGAFIPLDEFIAGDAAATEEGEFAVEPIKAERYYEPCWNETIYRNPLTGEAHCYAIPISVDNRALYYNKDRLEKAGLVDATGAPRPPVNWAELAKYGFELTVWEPEPPPAPASWDPATAREKRYQLMLALLEAGWQAEKMRPPTEWDTSESRYYQWALKHIWLGKEVTAFTDEERAYAGELTAWAGKRKIQILGFAPNYGNAWLYMYGFMNEAQFMSEDGKTCRLDEPAVCQALAYIKTVYDLAGGGRTASGKVTQGYEKVSGFQSGFGRDETDPFIQGKVVMKIDGVWSLQSMAQFGRDMNFAIAPPPRPTHVIKELTAVGKDPHVSWSGGYALAIPSAARNREAAWAFIRYMSSTEAQRIWRDSERDLAHAQGALFAPTQNPRRDLNEQFFKKYVLENPEFPEKFKDAFAAFNSLLPVARFRPVTPVGQRLWIEHANRTEEALHGTDIQEALGAGTRIVQRDLENFFRPPQGTPIRSWSWFFVLYPLLLTVLVIVAYLWDTNATFRQRAMQYLGMKPRKGNGVIEGSRGGYFRRQWLGGVACALPWIIGFIVLEGGPMLFSLIISFCNYDILSPPEFTGMNNFSWMFSEDEKFPLSLWNTFYMMIGLPLGLALGLAIALLLNMKIRGMAVWRTFFYLPAIVPIVAASVLWVWILNSQHGLLNSFLNIFLAPFEISPPGWLDQPEWMKPGLIIMGLWGAGAGMIIWLAGLKSIDNALYEAADVDGANEWQKLWHITLPQLTPYIFFNLVMGLIATFQIFAQAYIFTQGIAKDSLLFYVYHLFNNAFQYGKMGYASAMAWILFLIVLGFTILQLKLSKRWVHYEHE